VAVPVTLLATPAYAADGSIDHVEPQDGSFQVLYSLPGAGTTAPDLDSVAVTLDDVALPATAEPAGEAEAVERTTILAIDVSSSMRRDNRFAEAQEAAKAFLAAAPDDLEWRRHPRSTAMRPPRSSMGSRSPTRPGCTTASSRL
jgi:hypothetical protein